MPYRRSPLVLYWSDHPGTRQRTICGLEDRARSVIFKLEDKVLASAEGFYAMSQHAPLMNQLKQDTGPCEHCACQAESQHDGLMTNAVPVWFLMRAAEPMRFSKSLAAGRPS